MQRREPLEYDLLLSRASLHCSTRLQQQPVQILPN